MKSTYYLLLLPLFLSVAFLHAEPTPAETAPTEAPAAQTRGDTQAAVEAAERAAQAAPDNADVHAQLGFAYAQRIGEVQLMQKAVLSGKMRTAFETALALDPDHLGARIGLVHFLAHAPAIAGGSRTRATAEAEEVRRRDRFQGELLLGFVAAHFGEPAQAVEHYTKAVELQPEDASAHYGLATAQEAAGRPAEARAAYQRTLVLQPDHTGARDALARFPLQP